MRTQGFAAELQLPFSSVRNTRIGPHTERPPSPTCPEVQFGRKGGRVARTDPSFLGLSVGFLPRVSIHVLGFVGFWLRTCLYVLGSMCSLRAFYLFIFS